MAGAYAFGVILGTADEPQVAYLARPTEIERLAPDLGDTEPTRVLRIAAPCEQTRCAHHVDDRCSLGERIAQGLPAVVDMLPTCVIRSSCRWFAEQGGSICLKCPQVITRDQARAGNETLARAAQPPRM